MINVDHLEDVSLELSRLQELLAAMELLTDNLECLDGPHHRMVYSGIVGVSAAMRTQAAETRRVLEGLFPICRDAQKAA